jgi:hypothetical protein
MMGRGGGQDLLTAAPPRIGLLEASKKARHGARTDGGVAADAHIAAA